MDLHQVSKALSNPTRLNLLGILREDPRSAADAHRAYIREYEAKQRESIYRELEILVEASLLSKEYNTDEKEIQYRLRHEELVVDLANRTVGPRNGSE